MKQKRSGLPGLFCKLNSATAAEKFCYSSATPQKPLFRVKFDKIRPNHNSASILLRWKKFGSDLRNSLRRRVACWLLHLATLKKIDITSSSTEMDFAPIAYFSPCIGYHPYTIGARAQQSAKRPRS